MKAVEITRPTTPGDTAAPPCQALQPPLAYKYPLLQQPTYWGYKLSQAPRGRVQVFRSKWQSPPKVSIQTVGRELSVGVEAGVSLLLVPWRVWYYFGHPHPGCFVS
jgi:hypothetical protein